MLYRIYREAFDEQKKKKREDPFSILYVPRTTPHIM